MRITTAIIFLSAIVFCAADDTESVTQAGHTIQKLLNERIGKKIVEAAKEVKGILSKSLGSHVKKATAKLILDNAVDKHENQVTQNDGVASVGTDQANSDCINDCKMKKLAKQGKSAKPKIHHIKSMHKGAPGHHTPHNKGPRNRKNMPGPMPQMPNQNMQQQPQPQGPIAPTMPQQPPQPACPPPCPAACAPACTQDCCRPMLSLMQLPAPPPPYYTQQPQMAMCAPPCTQPSCAPACPPACCSAPPPPPPPPPPCPPICVQHCYTICPRGCCRSEIAHKKEKISHDEVNQENDDGAEEDDEEETGEIISSRKSGSPENNPMQRNKIPKRKIPTYNSVH